MKDTQPQSLSSEHQHGTPVAPDENLFVKLRNEQAMIQLGAFRKNRTRSLSKYSEEFGLGKTGLLDFVGHALASGNRFVFADMGCGNGLALREALLLADAFGTRANTNIFGVDALAVDEAVVARTVVENPEKFSPQLIQEEYRPQIYAADMDTFQFPEPADLVTFSNSLYYTRNPAQAIINALNQTNQDGVVCINGAERLLRITKGGPVSLIAGSEQLSRGFEVTRSYDMLVLKRNHILFNTDELAAMLFGGSATLRHRIATTERMIYEYHYEVQPPTPQIAP